MGCSIICSSVCSVDPMQPRRNLEDNNNVCKCSAENTAQMQVPLEMQARGIPKTPANAVRLRAKKTKKPPTPCNATMLSNETPLLLPMLML